VLGLYDADAGAVTPIVPTRPGQLRIYTTGVAETGQERLTGLRRYLLADLVRRVAERHRLVVRAWHGGEALPRGDQEALNVHPLEAAPEPPGALDVGIGARAAGLAAHWLHSAAVEPGDVEAGAGGSYAAAVGGRGLDPLALRLALLGEHYRRPVKLTWDELAGTDRALGEWRRQVAVWANSPSKPMHASYTSDVRAAFDDDLDVPAALRVLAALADDAGIAPGSKFESFVYVDHLLGLDLAREVGRF
jgi:cysteinyl-tRNA synthetase